MADTKISALPASTTPLAGTEVLPVVQSGATKQVSVANLTAGRNVAMLQGNATNAFQVTKAGSDTPWVGPHFTLDNGGAGAAERVFANQLSASNNLDTWYFDGSSWNKRVTVDTSGNQTVWAGNLVPATAAKGINFTANTPAAGMTSQLLNWYEEGTFTPTIASDAGSVTLSTAVGKYTRVGRQVTINANVTVSASTASSNVYLASLPFTSASNAAGSFYGYSFNADVGTPMMSIDSGQTSATIQHPNGSGSVATLGPKLQAGTVMYFSLTYFV